MRRTTQGWRLARTTNRKKTEFSLLSGVLSLSRVSRTDEEHPATIKDILSYLENEEGIKSNRETIADDVLKLQDAGFDIICNRKRQNQYFVGDRTLELSEVKIIIDAIQSAKFISNSKSKMLIDKLSSICGYHHSEELKRNLYVDGKVKTDIVRS